MLKAMREQIRIVGRKGNANLVEVGKFYFAAEKFWKDLTYGNAQEEGTGDLGDFNVYCLANKFYKLFNRTLGPTGSCDVDFEVAEKIALFHLSDDDVGRVSMARDKSYDVSDGGFGEINNCFLKIRAAVLMRKQVVKDDRWEEAVIVYSDDEIENVASKDFFVDETEDKFLRGFDKKSQHRADDAVHSRSFIVVTLELDHDGNEAV